MVHMRILGLSACAAAFVLAALPIASGQAAPQESETRYFWCWAAAKSVTPKRAWASRVYSRTGTFNESIDDSEAKASFDSELTRDNITDYRISCLGPYDSRSEATNNRTAKVRSNRNSGWDVVVW